MATKSFGSQFTYDFGIAIAQSTVNKLVRLTGATVTLASAFYALQQTADKYVNTIRDNALQFGGITKSIQAIEQAQNRILGGLTTFSVDDQLSGMRKLMQSGLDVQKNFELINKGAHAMGASFTQFASAISQGIQGNMGSLVEMGFLTERAVRMFEKYPANTIMRQSAIINFVKQHKGLQNVISQDFSTIQDKLIKLKTTWSVFLKSIIGTPNDPQSLYGQITQALGAVADSFASSSSSLKKYGFAIGQYLGWTIKNLGKFVAWMSTRIRETLDNMFKLGDNYAERIRSSILWLEFWKLRLKDLFKQYGSEIKMVLKLLIAYKALKTAFVISNIALASLVRYKKGLQAIILLQQRYRKFTGASWLMSLAAFLPRWSRRIWIKAGKFFADLGILFSSVIAKKGFSGFGRAFKSLFPKFSGFFGKIGKIISGSLSGLGKTGRFLINIFRNLPAIMTAVVRYGKLIIGLFSASNPVGWIILAISLIVVMYQKFMWFRNLCKDYWNMIMEYIRMVYNMIIWLYVKIRAGLTEIWDFLKGNIITPISKFFKEVGGWISSMWNKFKDSSVGKWVDKWIVQPIVAVFDFISKVISKVGAIFATIGKWFRGGGDYFAEGASSTAKKYGFSAPVMSKAPLTLTKESGDPSKLTKDGTKNVPNNDTVTNPIVFGTPEQDLVTDGATYEIHQGAIQINIAKGDHLDEYKLARLIRKVLSDIGRENNKRGGDV